MEIKILEVVAYSNLMVMQEKEKNSMRNERLKQCRHTAWDGIELFDAFVIKDILREQNAQANALFVVVIICQT